MKTLRELTLEIIRDRINEHRGVKVHAADSLGIGIKTIRRAILEMPPEMRATIKDPPSRKIKALTQETAEALFERVKVEGITKVAQEYGKNTNNLGAELMRFGFDYRPYKKTTVKRKPD